MTRQSLVRRNRSETSGTLAEKAMLIKLKQSNWDGKVYDKGVSEEIAVSKGADSKVYTTRKKILVDFSEYEEVARIGREVYDYHKKHTSPWLDNGYRVKASTSYMKYTEVMRKFKDELDAAVPDMLNAYPHYVQNIAPKKIGDGYDASEYPTVHELKNKFGFTVSVLPLPTADDFRVTTLDEEEIAIIKKSIADAQEETNSIINKDIWNRLHTVIYKLHERLESGTGFKDSLINNIEEVTDLIPELNLSNDPEINRIRKVIENEFCTIDPKDLREDEGYKMEIQSDAKALLDTMAAYCG